MGRSRIATGGETELMGKRDLRIYALLDTLKESPVLSKGTGGPLSGLGNDHPA